MAASFPSSPVFMCLTTCFPWKETCPVSSSSHEELSVMLSLGMSFQSRAGFSSSRRESSPQSLSMENSTVKLLKINIGIIALHSPQATFVLKWNSYLFSVGIFWWVFLFCSLPPKDWVFLYSRRVHAHNYTQAPICNFYFVLSFHIFIL